MEYEWDDEKRQSNLGRHGFDFIGIESAFDGVRWTIADDRFDYGEIRSITFAFLEGRIVTIVHADTDNVRRIISVRKATPNEQRKFYKEIADRLGEN